MPYLDSPASAFQQATQASETDFDFTTADAEERILTTNPVRKGHLVTNTGTSLVIIIYGLMNPETDDTTEIYRIPLSPGSTYIHDFVELIPHTAISSTDDASIRVVELF